MDLQGPLHVEGWDKALAEVSKACMGSAVLSSASAAELVRCVTNLPALVVAGVQDRLVPLKTAQSLTSQLPLSVSFYLPVYTWLQNSWASQNFNLS
jgi:hypothetical protein